MLTSDCIHIDGGGDALEENVHHCDVVGIDLQLVNEAIVGPVLVFGCCWRLLLLLLLLLSLLLLVFGVRGLSAGSMFNNYIVDPAKCRDVSIPNAVCNSWPSDEWQRTHLQ